MRAATFRCIAKYRKLTKTKFREEAYLAETEYRKNLRTFFLKSKQNADHFSVYGEIRVCSLLYYNRAGNSARYWFRL